MIVQCSKCGASVVPRRSDGSCPSCGGVAAGPDDPQQAVAPAADANPYAPPRTAARAPSHERRTADYRSAQGIAGVVVMALGLVTAATVVRLGYLIVNGLPPPLEPTMTARGPRIELRTWDYLQWISVLISAVTAVVYCMWFHRANQNARALGARQMQYAPSAWAWFFCPFANLVVPYFAVSELYRMLSKSRSVPAIFPLWWTLWIASSFVVTAVAMFATATGRSLVVSEMIMDVGQGTAVAAAICAIAVVRAIQRLHESVAAEQAA